MNGTMMQFEGVAAVVAVIAIVFLFGGYKLLASSDWLGGWLRGNLGILCVLLTGALVLCVIDVRTYKPMFDDKTVATLSLRETTPQHYEVRLVDALGVESRYSISGDSWRLTANQFRWSKRLSLGLGHGYRFTLLEGLYEKAPGTPDSATLSHSRYVDVWKFLSQYAPGNFLFSTSVMVTSSQPLADAAMYEVVPLGFDLVVRPLNELAKRAQMAAAPPATAAPVAAATTTITTTTTEAASAVAPVANAADAAATTTTTPAAVAPPATEPAPAAQENPAAAQ